VDEYECVHAVCEALEGYEAMVSKQSRIGMAGRPVRRVVVGVSLISVALAGSAAIAAASDDGRDGSTVPTARTDAPAPVPAPNDLDRGSGDAVPGAPVRSGDAVPGAPVRSGDAVPGAPVGQSRVSATAKAPIDNGRGGPDPAAGPFAPAAGPFSVDQASRASAAVDSGSVDSGSVDTDSGEIPVPDFEVVLAGPAARAGTLPPVDQDVPGAARATDGTRGSDAPSNDRDG
jgi:hypothetical protein